MPKATRSLSKKGYTRKVKTKTGGYKIKSVQPGRRRKRV